MSRRSSHTITYADLVQWCQRQVIFAEMRKTKAQGNGVCSLEGLTKDAECAKLAAKLFKKCEPRQQADLYELFKSVNSNGK